MLPIVIPGLNSPFPARINPAVQRSFAGTRRWVQRFRLHEGNQFSNYEKEGLSWMTARFYPNASFSRLVIADKFNTLLFALDDLMDHNDERSVVISSRKNFQDFIVACLRIMEGSGSRLSSETGHLSALADVWAQVAVATTSAWQSRFIGAIRQMFDAALWAHDNVAAGRLPSIEEFYRRRPFLGAANTSTDMIEFAEGVQLPAELFAHPTVMELTRLCQITVCLANDLFSLSKEMQHSDPHNMVTITMAERRQTLEQAIRSTIAMHDADVATFIRLSQQLPASGEHQAVLQSYVTCLTALMRGNIDWSRAETSRYKFVYKEYYYIS